MLITWSEDDRTPCIALMLCIWSPQQSMVQLVHFIACKPCSFGRTRASAIEVESCALLIDQRYLIALITSSVSRNLKVNAHTMVQPTTMCAFGPMGYISEQDQDYQRWVGEASGAT